SLDVATERRAAVLREQRQQGIDQLIARDAVDRHRNHVRRVAGAAHAVMIERRSVEIAPGDRDRAHAGQQLTHFSPMLTDLAEHQLPVATRAKPFTQARSGLTISGELWIVTQSSDEDPNRVPSARYRARESASGNRDLQLGYDASDRAGKGDVADTCELDAVSIRLVADEDLGNEWNPANDLRNHLALMIQDDAAGITMIKRQHLIRLRIELCVIALTGDRFGARQDDELVDRRDGTSRFHQFRRSDDERIAENRRDLVTGFIDYVGELLRTRPRQRAEDQFASGPRREHAHVLLRRGCRARFWAEHAEHVLLDTSNDDVAARRFHDIPELHPRIQPRNSAIGFAAGHRAFGLCE